MCTMCSIDTSTCSVHLYVVLEGILYSMGMCDFSLPRGGSMNYYEVTGLKKMGRQQIKYFLITCHLQYITRCKLLPYTRIMLIFFCYFKIQDGHQGIKYCTRLTSYKHAAYTRIMLIFQ